jgi:hypothetical protein
MHIGKERQTPRQVTGEPSEEITQTTGTKEGQEGRETVRPEGTPRNQKEVKKEGGNVPSVASQVIGTISSPFGYIGEEGWKGIAGIARTIGADKVAEYASQTGAQSVEEWATTFGGTPQKEGVGKTIGQVGAFALEAPLMFTGAGMAGFLAQGYGGMKEDLRNKYIQQGLSEDDANTKSTTHAALNTVAAIPAYILGGKVAGKAADALISESSPALLELAGRFGMNGMANMVASAAARGFGAALEGEDIGAAMKDVSLSGVLQDFAFAGHSTGEWFRDAVDKGAAAKTLSDDQLRVASESKDRSTRIAANEEIKAREATGQAKAAEQAGLPETAKVVAEPQAVKPEPIKPSDETTTPEEEEDQIPMGEPSLTHTHALEPKGDQKPIEGTTIFSAAYRDPETGVVHEGDNHQEAMKNAGKKPIEEAADRETDDFGYVTERGEFISRKDAQVLAEKSGQFLGKNTDRPVMHSNEVALGMRSPAKPNHIKSSELVGKNAKEALDHISQNTKGVISQFAKLLSKFAGKQKLAGDLFQHISLKEIPKGFDPSKAVAWRSSKGTVNVPRGDISHGTIIHEIFHTLTQNELEKHIKESVGLSGSSYLDSLNKSLSSKQTPEPIKRVINLYKKTINDLGLNEKYFGKDGLANHEDINVHEVYGLADVHEFISEAFANGKFQDLLDTMKGDGQKSIWKSLLEALGEMFNVKSGSMLESVMDASLGVVKVPREVQTPMQRFRAVAASAPKQTTPEKESIFHKALEEAGLFQDDLKAMGAKDVENHIKQAGKGLFSGIRDAVTMVADVLEGKTIPKLTNAGVKLTATQHAQARRMLDPYVKHLISEVFPDLYKTSKEGKQEIAGIEYQIDKKLDAIKRLDRIGAKKKYTDAEREMMGSQLRSEISKLYEDLEASKDKHDRTRQVMDIINKDNILGGADIIREEITSSTTELEDLRKAYEDGTAERGAKSRIKELEGKIADQTEALAAIEKVHDLEKYGREVEAAKGTFIEDNINRWKEKIHPLMDELYKKVNATETVPETERGRVFGVRVNLLAKHEAMKYMEQEAEQDGPIQPMMGVNYRNPDIKRDMLAKKAAFNSEYSNDVEAILKNSFGQRMNEASKMDFYNDLLDKGVAVFPREGESVREIQGKPARRMEIEWPTPSDKTGRTTMENRSIYVRSDLYNEIAQILELGIRNEQNPVLKSVTKLQIIGIADATSHLKNLLSVVTNALGRDSQAKDLISKIPILGSINAVREIRSVMREIQNDSPQIRKELADLARTSGTRPHYEQTGVMAMLTKHQHDLLHEVDMAARIIMSRRYKNLVDRFGAVNTPEAKIDFVNQIGEYNRRLMNRHEAALRDVGVSPFIVAGRAMNRMARRLVTASPGFKTMEAKAHLEARAIQATGLVMATVVPAMVNLMTTGSMFGRAGTPIGAIDFGPNFDTSDGKKRIFDLFQLVGIRRGLRSLGLNAAFEGLKNGSSVKEIQKNAFNDIFTTAAHPFIGPGVGLGYETLTGKRLDMRAGFSDIYTSRKVGGWMQYVENLRTGLKQQNELLYGTGMGYAIEKGMELGGIPRPVEQNTSETLRDLGLDKDIPVVSQLGKAAYTAVSTAVSAAGGKLNVSPALKLSAQLGTKQQYDPQQDIRYSYRQQILRAVKEGKQEEAMRIYEQGFKNGILTKADNKTIKGQIKQPDLLFQRVSRLKTPEDALSVFRVATAEEQDQIMKTVLKKIKGASAITPEAKQKMIDEFRSVAKKGSYLYSIVNQ